MKTHIYLDNSATTPLCAPAAERMRNLMDTYGNPSSLHSAGLEAERILSGARREILEALGCPGASPKQLVFCGSGTEANNLALLGSARAKDYKFKPRIISTDGEHPSVEEPLRFLEGNGFEIIRIKTEKGRIDTDSFFDALTPETILVSIMLVNNETGALYDLPHIFSEVKKRYPDTIIHCDAVQGFLKLSFSPQSLSADLVTINAHKIGGPKGVGALYVAPEILTAKKIVPLIYGGGQEHGLRSGTENTLAIAGFGAAAKYGKENLKSHIEKTEHLRELLLEKIASDPRLAEIRIKRPEAYIPNIINITLPSIRSEIMLHFLSARGIYVSSGSACSSRSKDRSRALLAFGATKKETDTSLRISLSPDNTEEDITIFTQALAEGVASLIRI